jgi:hypothetical protein
MIDSTEIYVTNLSESLQQLTTYVGLSLSAAMSAWILDRPVRRGVPEGLPSGSASSDTIITIPSLPVPISREDARFLLILPYSPRMRFRAIGKEKPMSHLLGSQ